MKTLIQVISLFLLFAAVCLAQTKEKIRVGVFLDMSGHTSSFGESTYNGIKMAVDEINASGGIDGRKIEIFLEDDQGTPEKAKSAAIKLIEEFKVQVLIGEVASSNSLAAAPEAQRAKIPMITPSSTNPQVTQKGNFIFRACFVDPFQGEAMAKFALYELNAKKVAIMSDVNSDYSRGLAKSFTDVFTKSGGKIIAQETFTQQDPDFKAQLIKIRQLKPDVIYIPGYYGQVGIIAKQARELKMNMPLLGGDGWDSPDLWKLGGNALKNSYVSNHFSTGSNSAEVQRFAAEYKKRFAAEPDTLAALGYDTVNLLADAIRRAKTTDNEKLREAIARTTNFYGVTGKISRFDASRNAIKPVVILKSNPQNSEFVYYSTVQP